jgi:hypothetical protein
MLKRVSFVAVVAAAGALQAANADILLSFEPQSQTVAQGDTVSVDAVLSGLAPSDQILSAFDVSVDFNSAVLQFESGTSGTDFGSSLSFSGPPSAAGSTISWDLLSLETDSFLQGLQGDSVTLGTLTFNALSAGNSALTYSYSDLTGLNGEALTYDLGGGNIDVTGATASVPEPGTLLLFGMGALGILLVRRRSTKPEAPSAS